MVGIRSFLGEDRISWLHGFMAAWFHGFMASWLSLAATMKQCSHVTMKP
jgi:hypothetical protein